MKLLAKFRWFKQALRGHLSGRPLQTSADYCELCPGREAGGPHSCLTVVFFQEKEEFIHSRLKAKGLGLRAESG